MRLPTRPALRRALVALVAVGAVALTSACTGDADEPTTTSGQPAGSGEGGQVPPVDDVATQVIAEQTVDTPVGADSAGGELTLTLRDVRVDAGVLTVRWALRWDAPDRDDDDSMSLYDLGLAPAPLVTDTTHLQAFRPLCVKGDWNGGAPERMECQDTMLASPVDRVGTKLRNHSTLEGWAALPAPENAGGSLDVLVAEGLPVFTGVTARQGA
ncbi:hypothetical protein [Cellulomonas dongxiuzhuiae]|uniref:Secreted protein n=1 Tax=Cellulomonas dongxiuzhuiae TaxID=2819979 RepID=A0ABX8GI80_9CELL|nr:hypothetical protein [Cellulomonas dongxiuzhuiae]MBO3088123.1 hypothetical protein [Cellulomonas dongxiuzhuiae]MBO3094530.1 hypothetical protein [Cellulomonas dongxiuzhuiae]QWC15553.1 hypothetical protein KKR89_14830 [Cellulomonas dongxiuzhuiae]